MTLSSLSSLSSQISAAHEALSAQRSALVEELLATVPAEVPFYGSLPEEAREAIMIRLVDMVFAGLAAPGSGSVRGWARDLFPQRVAQGITLPDVLKFVRLGRRAFLARARAVVGSPEAAFALTDAMDAVCDELLEVVGPVLQRRVEEARAALGRMEAQYEELYLRTPAMMYAIDAEDFRILTVSDRWLEVIGYAREEVVGRRSVDFLTEDARRRAVEVNIPRLRREGSLRDAPLQVVTRGGEILDVLASVVALRGESGASPRFLVVMNDVTARLRAERELRESEAALRRSEAQAQVIKAQEELLRSLSAPLIPLGDGVVVMPLIGRITAERAGQLVEQLVEGVGAQAAHAAILDVTGVPEADTGVALALGRAARAIGLLGAEVVLTGIQPEMARALVELGVDLGGITTRGTLRDGIAHALARAPRAGLARR